MLLRRVLEHVKTQNWTAVALDFAIVVLGILVAFWINAWSDGRTEQQDVTASLHSLHAEITANIQSLSAYRTRHDGVISAGLELIDLAHSSDLERVPTQLLGTVFLAAWTTDYSTGALTSLISTQRIDLIENRDLKLAIASLPRKYEDAFEDEHLVIKLIDTDWAPYIGQYVSIAALSEFQIGGEDGGRNPEALEPSEFLTILKSLEFQNHVSYRINYQKIIIREIDGLHESLEQTLKLIEMELEK